MSELEAIKKAFHRERQARKNTEAIIEQKSLELYNANLKLKNLNENLEKLIRERTHELEKAKEQAEEATKAKTQFLSTMSHEIRTPLNGIIGITELMIKINKDNKVSEMLSNVKYSADTLLAIINDILDFSKIESGKLTFEKAPFSIENLFANLKETFKFKAIEKGLDYQINIDQNIPKTLCGDEVKLSQILINLIGNAFKFTHEGGIKVSVNLLDNENSRSHLEFKIKDSGIGIPKENQQTIFESFTQSEASTTRKYGGTGLGLSITQKLITLQGGSISLKSEENMGSEFIFDLEFDHYIENEKPSKGSETTEDLRIGDYKILLAEDNKINQYVAIHLLKDWGLHYDVANNGVEASDYASKVKYDLILMDLEMPEMDGIEATKVIRKGTINQETPIIALTANAFSNFEEKVKSAGMNDFISKPIVHELLFKKLKNHLINE